MRSGAWAPIAATLVFSCGGDGGRQGSGNDSGVVSVGTDESGINPEDSNDDGEKFDLAEIDLGNVGPGDCGGMGGMGGNDFSVIWIANSPAGTVSKIDTKSGVELARYYSGPGNGTDDPSRTAVNLAGDVAVSNRSGSVLKIAAEQERCVDANNDGMITSSTGPADVLAWGTDECVLWYQFKFDVMGDNTKGPRPTAWDTGTQGNPCVVNDDRLWTGWFERELNQARFHRLDGASGTMLDEVVVPNWNSPNGTYGPYGGAVDGDNNMWVTGLWGPLVRIDAVTLAVDYWNFPAEAHPYGMTVDANGHPWTAGLNGELTHFDPSTQLFEVFPVPTGQVLRGTMIDREGQLWAAGNSPCALIQFDLASKTFVNANIALPGCGTPVGISIDIDGFVWVPDQGAQLAFKVDPANYTSTTTTGLVAPYTYSDMTGAGLGLVTNPPAG
jgi:streptogramin lyase